MPLFDFQHIIIKIYLKIIMILKKIIIILIKKKIGKNLIISR